MRHFLRRYSKTKLDVSSARMSRAQVGNGTSRGANVAVDGGMEYLKRIGKPEDYRDMSVTIPAGVVDACNRAINDTIRNTPDGIVGVVAVVVRVLRDNGIKLKETLNA